jgi:hypothetical protein
MVAVISAASPHMCHINRLRPAKRTVMRVETEWLQIEGDSSRCSEALEVSETA